MRRPSHQTLALGAAGLILYLIFLAVLFPAGLAWSLAQKDLPGLKLSGIEGSLWKGSASHAYYRNEPLGRLEWRLSPWALISARPGADIHLQRDGESFEATIRQAEDNGLLASNLRLSLHGETLRNWTAPYLLHGEIKAELSSLNYRPGKQIQAEGRITIDNAEVEGPQSLALGRIDARIEPAAEGSELTFENKDSPLDMKGNIRVNPNGNYRVTAGVLNRDKRRKDIIEALKVMGKQDATGRTQLSYYGRLRLR